MRWTNEAIDSVKPIIISAIKYSALTLMIGLAAIPNQAQGQSNRPATQPAPKSKSPVQASNTNSKQSKPNPAPALDKATAAEGKYVLKYRMTPGQIIRSITLQNANTNTRIQGFDDTSEARTKSEKIWEVKSVTPEGNMTFEYRIDAVDMAQKKSGEDEVSYNSRTDKEAPPVFASMQDIIGKPLATVTIDPSGAVITRDQPPKAPPLGLGDIAAPLPKESVAIGASWDIPRECRVKLEDGTHKVIKIRELYTLEKVSAGVATIRIESQPLTPVPDSAVEAQLCQQLSKGFLKFDMDKGQLISKQLEWDHDIVAFRGADTFFKYNARFTEEVQPETARSASKPSAKPKSK